MTWWIVLLLVGAALSPLVWLRPSPQQRGQMELRLAARRLGLGMQLGQQQWPHWLEKQPPERCAQYHRGRRAGRSDSWSYWQVAPGQWCNQWREPCADAAMLERLLPPQEADAAVLRGFSDAALVNWNGIEVGRLRAAAALRDN